MINHPGNIEYRRIVNQYLRRYIAAAPGPYSFIIRDIVQEINALNMTFKKMDKDKQWTVLGEKETERKIMELLAYLKRKMSRESISESDTANNNRKDALANRKNVKFQMNVSSNDIIFGRSSQDYPGNVVYRSIVETYSDRFIAAAPSEHKGIIREVLHDINARNMTFKYIDKASKQEFVLGEEEVNTKILQLFYYLKTKKSRESIAESDKSALLSNDIANEDADTHGLMILASASFVRDPDMNVSSSYSPHYSSKRKR